VSHSAVRLSCQRVRRAPVPWALVKRYPNSPSRISAAIRALGSPPHVRSVLPEALEPVCRELGVSHRVLNVLVPQIVLQRARVLPVVGELEAAGVAQHVRVRTGNANGLASPIRPSVLRNPAGVIGAPRSVWKR